MRFLVLSMFAALLLSGCALEIEHGYYRHSSPGGHHHGHRGYHRHYWNHAGEVYSESAEIHSLVVLPMKLPSEMKGEFVAGSEKKLREEWPLKAAQIVAANLLAAGDIRVAAAPGDSKPSSGYYMEIEITQFDAGSRQATIDGTNGIDGWCYLLAKGRIFNAATGKVVVELTFEESTGRYTEAPPFEDLIAGMGADLVDWFRDKQANPPTKS
jgi:hypothetical protein